MVRVVLGPYTTFVRCHSRPPNPSDPSPVGRILAIANQKGGVGKTTTAVNLAASLAVAERRVLLIDADPQGNATSGCGLARDGFRGHHLRRPHSAKPTVDDAIVKGVQFKHLDIMPATPDLAGAEVELVDDR